MTNNTDTNGVPWHIYTEAELAAIRRECEHEDEIEALREADAWDNPDYTSDGSGQ